MHRKCTRVFCESVFEWPTRVNLRVKDMKASGKKTTLIRKRGNFSRSDMVWYTRLPNHEISGLMVAGRGCFAFFGAFVSFIHTRQNGRRVFI